MSEGVDALVYLDGGDLLFKGGRTPQGTAGDDLRRRARLVARSVVRMGVGAVNVGRLELSSGFSFVREVGEETGIPWVSANLLVDGGHPFPRWRIVPWGGVRLGVIGLLRPEPRADERLGIGVDDPATALGEAMAGARGEGATHIVVLSNLGLDRERALVAAVPGVWAVVGGGTTQYLRSPRVEGDTLIFHASNRGRYLGVLDTPRSALEGWHDPLNLEDRTTLASRRDAARNALAGIEDTPENSVRRDALARQVVWLEASLDKFSVATAIFRHKIVPLDEKVGEDPGVASWVAAVKPPETPSSRRAKRPQSRRQHPAADTAPWYTGTAGCRQCHPGPYRVWAATAHARSMAVLGSEARTPRCQACHGAQLDKVGGAVFEPVVGCEVCHGPGGNHREGNNVVRRPPPATCRRCHRGYHEDETFDPVRSFDAIRCDGKGPGPRD